MDLDLVPITLFLVIGVVLVAYFYFRHRARLEVQQTVRAAMERGHDLTPELLAAIGSEASSGPGDLRRGVLWLALAAAVAILAWVVETRELLGPAAFPLMIGLAYMILWRLNAGKEA
jgi:hypothetical protein